LSARAALVRLERVSDAQAASQVPIVFAGLLVLAALGIVLYAASASIEKRFTRWAFRGQANH
jgi:NitT/TauT family transport system permease protein